MKVIVLGCTHAGTSAIVNIRSLYSDSEVTVYEKNDNISFLSCGIALHVGGVVKDPSGLFYSSPEKLAEIGVTTKMLHEVFDVDTANKIVSVRNLETGEVFTDSYDKLVVTTGSWPIIPKIQGIDLNNVLICKNYSHSKTIIEKAATAKSIIVVGAGYIGVELAEAFASSGKKVTLVDAEDRILSKYYDKEFTDILEAELEKNGVQLALGQMVQRFNGDTSVNSVETDKITIEGDLVILAIGFRPTTSLFKDKLDMLPNGALLVDEYMHTSDKDILAAGDCCAVVYNPTGKHQYIPLATNAVRMGALVAKNLDGNNIKYLGTQGTSAIKIYSMNCASTGMIESVAVASGFEIETVILTESNRPEFMPTYNEVLLKVVYDKNTRRVLGAQIVSDFDMTQTMNTMSVVIQNKMTIDELGFIDFFFQPHYNKPWNILNTAGLKATGK